MKLLVTGVTGFVSSHFLALLNDLEPGSEVLGIDKNEANSRLQYPRLNMQFQKIDLLNKAEVGDVLVSFQPEYILHLASVSSVAQSWHTPLDSFVNNTNIFLNLVEQVRINKIVCRILSVGSSEEYGQVTEDELPLTEDRRLNPLSPYAVARVAQEMLSTIYAEGFHVDIIITRSFNHIGPGQSENFVISSFARQLVQLSKKAGGENKIITGDLSIIRDFLDVRDVVKAYYALFKHGRKGEVYNVCSGNGHPLKDIILMMSDLLGLEIKMETDPQLVRPNDNKVIIGSYEKINRELGWRPEIPIDQSLTDVIAYWQQKLG